MTKLDKIKAEIERRMKYFQQEKDALPITPETRTDRFSLGARISMCEELLEYINDITDDEPQQPQQISVPFGNVVDNCAAKYCWEHGGVCTNPHRDCIGCPKDWNLGFNTYTSNKIEGNLSANPKDCHVTIKPKISEDTWNANIKGACKLSVAPEVKCGEVCDHCLSQPICDKPEKSKENVEPLSEDADKTTWTWKDEEMFKNCVGVIQGADWDLISVNKREEMVDWLCKRFNKEITSND